MSINADQAQDSVQRLEPFCMLAAGWQPDEIEEKTASLMEDFDALEFEGLIFCYGLTSTMPLVRGAESSLTKPRSMPDCSMSMSEVWFYRQG
jgi:hypothetical protein